MLSKACGVCIGLGLASVVWSSSAQAQAQQGAHAQANREQRPAREAVVLSLNGSLVDYERQTLKADKPEGSSVDPSEVKTSQTTYGPLGAGLGFGIGYAWDQVLLGARAELTHLDSSEASGVDNALTQVSLLPRVEYSFTRDTTRPFIAGILGIQYTGAGQTVSTMDFGGAQSSTKLEGSSTRLAIGAAFGLHGFLNHSVSLDPELTVLYSTGSGTVENTSANAANDLSLDYSISTVRVLFSLGLSGWLDTGGPLPPPRAEVTHPPSTQPAPPVSEEPESKAISADVPLPQHRRIYIQLPKDPARPSVLIRLTARPDDTAISNCDDVTLSLGSEPMKLPVRSRGENFLTSRLPIVGLQALANNPYLVISVCGDDWPFTPEAREAVQDLLKARRDLLDLLGEIDEPEPAPPPDPAAASPSSSASVLAPASAPVPAPTPAPALTPSGSFPPVPTATPATDKSSPPPQKPAQPKP